MARNFRKTGMFKSTELVLPFDKIIHHTLLISRLMYIGHNAQHFYWDINFSHSYLWTHTTAYNL
jgi:hypothetical protein